MRWVKLQTIGAFALGSALVASTPILQNWLGGPHPAFFADDFLIPLCAAIGGLAAGVLIHPALGKPDWRGWATGAAFALVGLAIAASIGGFLLVVFFTDGFGEPGVLARFTDGLHGAMFALLYLLTLMQTALGIAAIAAHVVLAHLAARSARRDA